MANNGKKLKKNDKKPQAKRVMVSKKEYDTIYGMYEIRLNHSMETERLLKESVNTNLGIIQDNLRIIGKLDEAVVQSNINWRIAVYSFAGLLIQTIIALNAIL